MSTRTDVLRKTLEDCKAAEKAAERRLHLPQNRPNTNRGLAAWQAHTAAVAATDAARTALNRHRANL